MAITNATNATPIVVTSAAHGFSTGDVIEIVGVVGNTAANHVYKITVIDVDSFSLNDSVGNGDYSSDGTAYLITANYKDHWGGDIDIGETTTVVGRSDPINLLGPSAGVWPYGILDDGQQIEYLVVGSEENRPDLLVTIADYTDGDDAGHCDNCLQLNDTHHLPYIGNGIYRKEITGCSSESPGSNNYIWFENDIVYVFASKGLLDELVSWIIRYQKSSDLPHTGTQTLDVLTNGGVCNTVPESITITFP